MKEHPILFNGEMVRAILEGRKTQTRRPIKPQPVPSSMGDDLWVVKTDGKPSGMACINATDWDVRYWCEKWLPYEIGDRLWVRETFVLEDTDEMPTDGRPYRKMEEMGEFGHLLVPHYRATEPEPHIVPLDLSDSYDDRTRWRPSIHMPRWASRIALEVTGVRIQRVQEIGDSDAWDEGSWWRRYDDAVGPPIYIAHGECIDCFREQWDALYAKRGLGWDVNPWVWVIEFRELRGDVRGAGE